MAAKKKPDRKPDDAEQSARFVEKAKELGVDESGEAFDRALRKITNRDETAGDNHS